MAEEETGGLKLPIIDLYSSDKISTASDLRQACVEYGFFYLINHGVEEEFLKRVFDESMKFFSLPIKEKMKLARKGNRGYTPSYAEKLNSSSSHKGDSKENFDVCPFDSISSQSNLNQWPPEEVLPFWRATMESYSERILSAGKKLMSLIALALNLDEDFFEKVGAFSPPTPFLRLLHYPGKLGFPGEDIYGASPHSDYGMITLLATDGVSGLQVCRDKFKQPMVWEDVPHINGALVVNIGEMTERWTNCLFQSTLHRVVPTGLERYSASEFSFSKLKDEESFSNCHSCSSSSMANTDLLQTMPPPPEMKFSNLINIDSNLPSLNTSENDDPNKSPLTLSFTQLPNTRTDIGLLPECQDTTAALGLAETNFLDVPQLSIGSPFPELEAASGKSGVEKGENENVPIPESFFDELPADLFDFLEQFPRSSPI